MSGSTHWHPPGLLGAGLLRVMAIALRVCCCCLSMVPSTTKNPGVPVKLWRENVNVPVEIVNGKRKLEIRKNPPIAGQAHAAQPEDEALERPRGLEPETCRSRSVSEDLITYGLSEVYTTACVEDSCCPRLSFPSSKAL